MLVPLRQLVDSQDLFALLHQLIDFAHRAFEFLVTGSLHADTMKVESRFVRLLKKLGLSAAARLQPDKDQG